MTDRLDDLDELVALFATDGAREYFGEPVTQAQHMLQAATIAEEAGASPSLVAAALLHDVGHFHGALRGSDLVAGRDNDHAEVGAKWLSRWFGPEVTEPVRLHVTAKRYLCAVEPAYLANLSPASLDSLRVQGGLLDAEAAADFAALAGASDAIAVRRWDDEAKSPDRTTQLFAHFLGTLRRLVRTDAV